MSEGLGWFLVFLFGSYSLTLPWTHTAHPVVPWVGFGIGVLVACLALYELAREHFYRPDNKN